MYILLKVYLGFSTADVVEMVVVVVVLVVVVVVVVVFVSDVVVDVVKFALETGVKIALGYAPGEKGTLPYNLNIIQ